MVFEEEKRSVTAGLILFFYGEFVELWLFFLGAVSLVNDILVLLTYLLTI
jgi:hypothetical protein